MPYKPVPEEAVVSETRDVMPVEENAVETRELLRDRLQRYAVYGLLLTPDAKHPFTKMITERWDLFHHMTGSKFLVLAFQPPDSFSREFESSWRARLGEDFNAVWGKWQAKKAAAYLAYDFEDMFLEPKIRRTEMPCLALFTSPEATRAAIIHIPDWSDEDVWKYLEAVCDTVDECASEPDPETRLALLERSLTSFPARARRTLGHLAEKADVYVRANPAKVAITTVSVVLALSTASFIPVGAAGIVFMKDIVDILKSA